eukprot:3175103-Rhodomonas_salina.1
MSRKLLEADPYTDDKLAGVLLLAEISLPVCQIPDGINSGSSMRASCFVNTCASVGVCDSCLEPGLRHGGQAGDLDGKENWDRACEQWRGLFMANKATEF